MLLMDHAEAARKLAVEQYLLGELSGPEREEFEEHFFGCPECVEALEMGTGFMKNARAAFQEDRALRPARRRVRWNWTFWTGWRLAPVAAFAGWALACVFAGYQFLGGLSPSSPFVIAPAVSIKATRAAQALTFSRRQAMIALTVPHEWEETYSAYQGEIERGADRRVVLSSKIAAAPGDFAISIRPKGLDAGTYVLALYGLREGTAEKTAVERVPFTLTE
jgi:anti-sigma factor RsiW